MKLFLSKIILFFLDESLLMSQQPYWYPFVASQFPAEYPFIIPDDSTNSQDDEREPMLSKNVQKNQAEVEVSELNQIKKQQLKILSQYPKFDANVSPLSLLNVSGSPLLNSQPVALIPVIVPVIATAVNATVSNTITAAPSSSTTSRAASLKRQRGVKFDETHL